MPIALRADLFVCSRASRASLPSWFMAEDAMYLLGGIEKTDLFDRQKNTSTPVQLCLTGCGVDLSVSECGAQSLRRRLWDSVASAWMTGSMSFRSVQDAGTIF